MHDQMQPVFDGAEAIQQALYSQAGCEMALNEILEPILARDPRSAKMVYAILEGMALFRKVAEREAQGVLIASLTRK